MVNELVENHEVLGSNPKVTKKILGDFFPYVLVLVDGDIELPR